jgi:hypothetical protein
VGGGNRPIVWGGKWNDKRINKNKKPRGFWRPPIKDNHTTTNQNWAGVGEARMEKRDKRGGVAEGCQCATSACARRERATYCIINNCMLLGHDAECHDPNTAMTASKIAGNPDLI